MAGQQWAVGARGGFLTNIKLSKKLREVAQPMMRFRGLVRPEMEFGKNVGDTLQFDKVCNVATEGRVISETETVPETNFTISKDTIVAKEYSNSVPFTWQVELFADLDIRSTIINALKNDMAKVLDKAAGQQFVATDLKYAPTGTETAKTSTITTNGTKSAATRNISVWDLKNIADEMRSTYKMPFYTTNDFMSVASTGALRGIKDDSEFVEATKYGDPDKLFSGECTRFYGVRFVEESNFLTSNGTGGLGEAVFFGEDPVVEIAVYPEEVQSKIGVDFGRDRAIRWVWVGGFKITWDFSTDGDARIFHLVSS